MSDYRTKIIIFLLRAFTPLREIQQRITTIAGRSYDRPQVLITHQMRSSQVSPYDFRYSILYSRIWSSSSTVNKDPVLLSMSYLVIFEGNGIRNNGLPSQA